MLDAVQSGVATLEAQCRDLGPLIDRLEWDGLDRLLSDMGRVRHELMNAWEATRDERTDEFSDEIAARIRRVLTYREWQLKRLQKLRDELGGRLTLVSRWKSYARSVAGRRQSRAALFTDVR